MADLIGRTLGRRYRIEAGLGRGGMAEVYRAFDTRRHYPVAVKVLREDLAEDWDFVRRFQAEAESLARLAHQNIVRFYSFEQDGRTAFIVMDLVEGDTLRGRIFERQGRPMAPVEVLPILRQVAAALAYAHAEGIIHRGQHHAQARRHGPALRFRHFQGRRCSHGDRGHAGYAGLHEPGAVPRGQGGRPHRCLLPGGGAV